MQYLNPILHYFTNHMLPYINQVQGCKFEALVWKSKKIIVYQSACLAWRFSIMENLGEDGCGGFLAR